MYLGVDARFRRSFVCHTSVIPRGEASGERGRGWFQGLLFNSQKYPFGNWFASNCHRFKNTQTQDLIIYHNHQGWGGCWVHWVEKGFYFFMQQISDAKVSSADRVESKAQEASVRRHWYCVRFYIFRTTDLMFSCWHVLNFLICFYFALFKGQVLLDLVASTPPRPLFRNVHYTGCTEGKLRFVVVDFSRI